MRHSHNSSTLLHTPCRHRLNQLCINIQLTHNEKTTLINGEYFWKLPKHTKPIPLRKFKRVHLFRHQSPDARFV